MDGTKTQLRQWAFLKVVCVWLLACAGTGCTSQGGISPWERILPAGLFKGQEPGAEGVSPDLASESPARERKEGESPPAASEPSPAMDPLQIVEREEAWPFVEGLDSSWRGALLRRDPLDLSSQDHPLIDRFVRYFQEDSGPLMEKSLAKSTKYLPMMREIFREEGLPEDLAFLALVESGFNPLAASPGNCVGLWQFTEGTGRRYGLRIDAWVDERRDPERSTRAAARYLRDLYSAFRSWDLAIAAYNAGEGNISAFMEKRNATSFWDLYHYPDMSRATRDFVPKVMAAMKVARDPESYGFGPIPYQEEWRFDRVRIEDHLDLVTVARLAGCTEQEIRALNPQIKGRSANPGASGLEIRVPEGKGEAFQSLLAQKGTMVHASRVAREATDEPSSVRIHRVKPGDTLEEIARSHGTTGEEIQRLNLLASPHKLRVGSQLSIPAPSGGGRKTGGQNARKEPLPEPSSVNGPASKGGGGSIRQERVHHVKKGETVWSIAQRYGVAVQDLFRWNELKGNLIRPGNVLSIRN